jgi:hypothetical protein
VGHIWARNNELRNVNEEDGWHGGSLGTYARHVTTDAKVVSTFLKMQQNRYEF